MGAHSSPEAGTAKPSPPRARADSRPPPSSAGSSSSQPQRKPNGVAGASTHQEEAWINDLLMAEIRRQAAEAPERPIVHTVHTEVEGLSRAELFADLLDRLLAEGARFERLDTVPQGPG